jgi:acetyl/propionyl-CoA carboxylase alpha subunit
MRSTFICLHCGGEFPRHPSVKNQKYCNAKECRKASRREWKREKYATNKSYRQKCLDQQKRWREKRPAHVYQKEYRACKPDYEKRNRELQAERNKKRQKEQDSMIVNRNTLSPHPSVEGTLSGTYVLMRVKGGKIVNRNTLMVRMQVLSEEAMILTQNSN